MECGSRDTPKVTLFRGNCCRRTWCVQQGTHLSQDRTIPKRSQRVIVRRRRIQLDEHLSAHKQINRISGVTLAEQNRARLNGYSFQFSSKRGELLCIEGLETTEALNRCEIDNHVFSPYTPRSIAAFATRPNATMYAAVRQPSFRDCTRSRIVA